MIMWERYAKNKSRFYTYIILETTVAMKKMPKKANIAMFIVSIKNDVILLAGIVSVEVSIV